jgi:hypothetical protein
MESLDSTLDVGTADGWKVRLRFVARLRDLSQLCIGQTISAEAHTVSPNGYSMGLKWLGLEASHLPSSSGEISNS